MHIILGKYLKPGENLTFIGKLLLFFVHLYDFKLFLSFMLSCISDMKLIFNAKMPCYQCKIHIIAIIVKVGIPSCKDGL